MIRYLKEEHETGHLYFTSDRNCEICEVCGDNDTVVWIYDTKQPKHKIIKSVFDLIVNDLNDIRDIEDLKILNNELHFESELFDKFDMLLKMKNRLNDYEVRYMLFKEDVLSYARKL